MSSNGICIQVQGFVKMHEYQNIHASVGLTGLTNIISCLRYLTSIIFSKSSYDSRRSYQRPNNGNNRQRPYNRSRDSRRDGGYNDSRRDGGYNDSRRDGGYNDSRKDGGYGDSRRDGNYGDSRGGGSNRMEGGRPRGGRGITLQANNNNYDYVLLEIPLFISILI